MLRIALLSVFLLIPLLADGRLINNDGSGRNLLKKDDDDKEGAGMLMFSNGTALIVLRGFKSNNPRTWTVPGGNVDSDDNDDLFETAIREVKEELGRLPANFTKVDEIVTIRGSDDKKYTVFLVEVPVEAKAKYFPILNKEHTNYKWFPFEELFQIFNLHPVLEELLENHRTELEVAFGLTPPSTGKKRKSKNTSQG